MTENVAASSTAAADAKKNAGGNLTDAAISAMSFSKLMNETKAARPVRKHRHSAVVILPVGSTELQGSLPAYT